MIECTCLKKIKVVGEVTAYRLQDSNGKIITMDKNELRLCMENKTIKVTNLRLSTRHKIMSNNKKSNNLIIRIDRDVTNIVNTIKGIYSKAALLGVQDDGVLSVVYRLACEYGLENTLKMQGNKAIYYADEEDVYLYPEGLLFVSHIPSFSSVMELNNKDNIGIENIILSNVYFANARSLEHAFQTCFKLKSINMEIFCCNNIISMNKLFYECNELENINNIDKVNTSKVIYFEDVFYNCVKLKELDLSKNDLSNVTYMSKAFALCEGLKRINFGNMNLVSAVDMRSLFLTCTELEELELNNMNTVSLETFSGAFAYCKKLKRIKLDNFKVNKLGDMNRLFCHCIALEKIEFTNFDREDNSSKNLKSTDLMFDHCVNLKEINLTYFNFDNLQSARGMFDFCKSLQRVIVTSKQFFILGKLELIGNSRDKQVQEHKFVIVDK